MLGLKGYNTRISVADTKYDVHCTILKKEKIVTRSASLDGQYHITTSLKLLIMYLILCS